MLVFFVDDDRVSDNVFEAPQQKLDAKFEPLREILSGVEN
jgi:hypothetical protein